MCIPSERRWAVFLRICKHTNMHVYGAGSWRCDRRELWGWRKSWEDSQKSCCRQISSYLIARKVLWENFFFSTCKIRSACWFTDVVCVVESSPELELLVWGHLQRLEKFVGILKSTDMKEPPGVHIITFILNLLLHPWVKLYKVH